MPTDDTPLNNTLRRLQQQRDDGIISAEEYRRKAAAAMDEHDPEKGPGKRRWGKWGVVGGPRSNATQIRRY